MNQLREEMAEKDVSLKIEQLQKEKKELQQLVTKYQAQKHVCIETASAATQTDEVIANIIIIKWLYIQPLLLILNVSTYLCVHTYTF